MISAKPPCAIFNLQANSTQQFEPGRAKYVQVAGKACLQISFSSHFQSELSNPDQTASSDMNFRATFVEAAVERLLGGD